jgi:hypothetical protein
VLHLDVVGTHKFAFCRLRAVRFEAEVYSNCALVVLRILEGDCAVEWLFLVGEFGVYADKTEFRLDSVDEVRRVSALKHYFIGQASAVVTLERVLYCCKFHGPATQVNKAVIALATRSFYRSLLSPIIKIKFSAHGDCPLFLLAQNRVGEVGDQ